jgi:hypothetical protein
VIVRLPVSKGHQASLEVIALSYNVLLMDRPRGITITAILMSITNAMGWMMIDWHANHARTRFFSFTVLILVGYLFLWFYWQGRNWARISVLVCSVIAVANLTNWNYDKPGTVMWSRHLMIAAEAIIGLFLLYWLNTSRIRNFFRQSSA